MQLKYLHPGLYLRKETDKWNRLVADERDKNYQAMQHEVDLNDGWAGGMNERYSHCIS